MQRYLERLTKEGQILDITPNTLKSILNSNKNDQQPQVENISWTSDPNNELPIIRPREGHGSIVPITVDNLWKLCLGQYAEKPAISEQYQGKWDLFSYA